LPLRYRSPVAQRQSNLPGKIIAFTASLIAAALPVTGFVIWYGRRKKSKKA